MSEVPVATQTPTPGLSLWARIWGILASPKETFADIVARPRWFGMIAVMVVVGVVGGAALMSTDAGKIAALDAARSQMESLGIQIPAEAQAQMEKAIMETPLWQTVLQAAFGQVAAAVVWPLILGGLLFLLFNAMLGGDASFKQLFAVVVHASPVQLVGLLFTMPLMYLRESMTGVTNLAVFLPMLDERSFLARFAGSIDLIRIWWIIVLSIGLGVLYRRKTGPIATGLFTVYGVVAAAWAAVLAWRGGV